MNICRIVESYPRKGQDAPARNDDPRNYSALEKRAAKLDSLLASGAALSEKLAVISEH